MVAFMLLNKFKFFVLCYKNYYIECHPIDLIKYKVIKMYGQSMWMWIKYFEIFERKNHKLVKKSSSDSKNISDDTKIA